MKLSYNFRVRTPTELFFPNITMYGYVHILTFSYIKTVKERTHINIFTLYYVYRQCRVGSGVNFWAMSTYRRIGLYKGPKNRGWQAGERWWSIEQRGDVFFEVKQQRT